MSSKSRRSFSVPKGKEVEGEEWGSSDSEDDFIEIPQRARRDLVPLLAEIDEEGIMEIYEREKNEERDIREIMKTHEDMLGSYCKISFKLQISAFVAAYRNDQEKAKDYLIKLSILFGDAYKVITTIKNHEFYEDIELGSCRLLKLFEQEADSFCENVKSFFIELKALNYRRVDKSLLFLRKRVKTLKDIQNELLEDYVKIGDAPVYDTPRFTLSGVVNFFARNWLFFYITGLLLWNLSITEFFNISWSFQGILSPGMVGGFWETANLALIRIFGAICLTFVASPWTAARISNFIMWFIQSIVINGLRGILKGFYPILANFLTPISYVISFLRYIVVTFGVWWMRHLSRILCLYVLELETFGIEGFVDAFYSIPGVVGGLMMAGKDSIENFLNSLLLYIQGSWKNIMWFFTGGAMRDFLETEPGKAFKYVQEVPKQTAQYMRSGIENVAGLFWDPVKSDGPLLDSPGPGMFVEDIDEDIVSAAAEASAASTEAPLAIREQGKREISAMVAAFKEGKGGELMVDVQEAYDQSSAAVKHKFSSIYEKQLLKKPVNWKMMEELKQLKNIELTYKDTLIMGVISDFNIWAFSNLRTTTRSSKRKKIFNQIMKWLPLIMILMTFAMTEMSLGFEDPQAIGWDYEESSNLNITQIFDFTG